MLGGEEEVRDGLLEALRLWPNRLVRGLNYR
jgi:hypothetical protein